MPFELNLAWFFHFNDFFQLSGVQRRSQWTAFNWTVWSVPQVDGEPIEIMKRMVWVSKLGSKIYLLCGHNLVLVYSEIMLMSVVLIINSSVYGTKFLLWYSYCCLSCPLHVGSIMCKIEFWWTKTGAMSLLWFQSFTNTPKLVAQP